MNVQLRDLSSVNPAPFVSPASYWLPELMAVSAWHEHAPFGFWLVNALRPRTIVELGVHHGYSYFVFCQAVQRLHLPARCFAIDTWIGDEHSGFYGDDVYAAVSSHNRRYNGFSRLIRSEFSDACCQFADGSIDLLHIDGCHTQEAARRDFENWLPKLSRRGVVLFHDTAEYGNGFGVHQLWEELRRRYPHSSSGTVMVSVCSVSAIGFPWGSAISVMRPPAVLPPRRSALPTSGSAGSSAICKNCGSARMRPKSSLGACTSSRPWLTVMRRARRGG